MKDQRGSVLRGALASLMGCLLGLAFVVRAVAAKEIAANDCLIGVENKSEAQLSGTVTCNDCDPACDADGQTTANGSCAFRIRGCLNIAGVPGCTPRPLKKFKFKTPHANNTIVVNPVAPTSASSVCGSFVDFTVPLRKKGKKSGKRRIIVTATADVKPFGKNKDQDKITFVCNPRPAGQSCPTPPTTSTTLGTTSTTETTTSTTSTSTEASTTSTTETTTTTDESTTTLETTTTTEESTTTFESTTTTEESTTTLETTTTTEESTTTFESTTTTEESTTTLETTTTTEESTTTTTSVGSPSGAFLAAVLDASEARNEPS